MRRLLVSATIVTVVLSCVSANFAVSAGSYDGKWSGQGAEKGDCGVLTVTLVISDSRITGTVSGKHGSPQIDSGAVNPDGRAKVYYAPKQGFQGTINFTGDKFVGQFATFCGVREVNGTRE